MEREWVTNFLASLAATPNVSLACRKAGVTRQAAYKLREGDPAFAAAWADALEEAVDDLVGDVWGRAKGADASDTLAIFLLKAHRPAVYRETVKQIHDFSGLSDEELVRRTAGSLAGNGPAGADAPAV